MRVFDARVRVKARFIYDKRRILKIETVFLFHFRFLEKIVEIMSLSLSFFLSFFTRGYARVEDDVHILNSQDILRTN